MYEMSGVHYLSSINRKVTEKTILERLRIMCQHYPFLLSFFQSFLYGPYSISTWMLYTHPKLNISKTSFLTFLAQSAGLIHSVFQAFNLPINLWLFRLLTLNLANFYCVRSYICSSNITGVYNLTTW